jgi:hypothetical protein
MIAAQRSVKCLLCAIAAVVGSVGPMSGPPSRIGENQAMP